MGAWGTGVWSNDDAADWLAELEGQGMAAVEQALSGVLAVSNEEYLEAPTASKGLAAAATVAALSGHLGPDAPDEARAFVASATATQGLRDLAIACVRRIQGRNSELADLWRDAGEVEFETVVTKLLQSLQMPPQPEAAKPRKPAAAQVGSLLKVGDVVSFQVGPTKVGLGHVRGKFQFWDFIAAFGPLDSVPSDLNAAVNQTARFEMLTDDRLVAEGRWNVVGYVAVASDIDLPAHQVSLGAIDNVMVEDFAGQRRRPATQEERRTLPHRSTSDPRILEEAMAALAGLQPWNPHYEQYRPSIDRGSKRLFDDKPRTGIRGWFHRK